MKILLSILLVQFSFFSYSETPLEIEKFLSDAFKKIDYWHFALDTSVDFTDSVDKANNDFQELLLKYTTVYPITIECPFKSLTDQGLRIHTSWDGHFRIYTWDDMQGGTMRSPRNIYQYTAKYGVKSKILIDYNDEDVLDGFYYDIYDIASGGKMYYITFQTVVGSSAVLGGIVKIFSIDGDSLNDQAKLIQTKTGLRNELRCDIDFSEEINHHSNLDRDLFWIKYDQKLKRIYLPLITEGGKLTSRKIIYQFNGKYFVKLQG